MTDYLRAVALQTLMKNVQYMYLYLLMSYLIFTVHQQEHIIHEYGMYKYEYI